VFNGGESIEEERQNAHTCAHKDILR